MRRFNNSRAWLVLALIGVLVTALLYMQERPRDVVEPVALPTVSASVSGASAPTPMESASPTVKPTPKPKPTPPMKDPRGKLVSMTVTHPGQSKPYIQMNFAPRVIEGEDFVSECGKVAWWGGAGIVNPALPGALSPHIALITGHVMCGSENYSIANLAKAKKGDVLRVYYDSGDIVTAKARSDVATPLKASVNKTKKYTENQTPARVIRLTSCDRSMPLRINGHSDYSFVVLFDRIS